jgi:hypothetical protein
VRDQLGIRRAFSARTMVSVLQEAFESSLPTQSPPAVAQKIPSVASFDARLSVWGQAAREGVTKRIEALIQGAAIYVETVGRSSGALNAPRAVDGALELLDTEYGPLVDLGATLLPSAIAQSCRLLWIDVERLKDRLETALGPSMEGARAEIRRRQALYRRRARLWQSDARRLAQLRSEIEDLRVPRCAKAAPERIARGLLERHRDPELLADGTVARWIAQLDQKIADASAVHRLELAT